MIQIHLQPSDLTPKPGPFQALLAEVLAAREAVWADEEMGDLRLEDGSEIGLFTDDEENVAIFGLDAPSEPAFDVLYDLAHRGAMFITVGKRACATLSCGDFLPGDEAQFDDPDDLKDRAAVGDWLRVEMHAAAAAKAAAEAPVSKSVGGPPQRSFFQRLSDSLFGRSI